MKEYLESNEHESESGPASSGANRWLVAALVALIVVAGLAFGYGYRQETLVGHLTAQESMAKATINEMQGQLNTLTAKLNEMLAVQQAQVAAAQAKTSGVHANAAGTKAAASKKGPTDNKRLKELQARIDEQQRQLKDTQDQVTKNRADLEGNLGSTRDELNGSIAKTHEELVALAKRGERSYFEFDLTKSKQFQRVGPLTLSLRKADTKHKSYDLEMVVDDNKLTKKKMNLYEPIWIHMEDDSQPLQVVVNRVQKDRVHGYVNAPRYKPSELALSRGPAAITPVAAQPRSPDQNSPSPKQPE